MTQAESHRQKHTGDKHIGKHVNTVYLDHIAGHKVHIPRQSCLISLSFSPYSTFVLCASNSIVRLRCMLQTRLLDMHPS